MESGPCARDRSAKVQQIAGRGAIVGERVVSFQRERGVNRLGEVGPGRRAGDLPISAGILIHER